MKSALQQGQGKKISIGLMIIIMAFMVVLPMVSASDFDNIVVDIPVEKGDTIIFDGRVIEYNPIWEKYAPVKIDNAFGMGSTLAEAYIEQHTDSCGVDCLSVFDIKTYGKSALVDDIRFNKLNEKGDWIRSNVRSYQFFVWDNPLSREESYLENVCTSTYNEETGDEISKSCENIPRTRTIYYKIIDDVQWICSPSGKFEVNGTAIQTCKDVVVGKKEYVYDGWVFYNIGDIKDAGKYKVKLIGDKRSEWIYDWQITTQGKIISDRKSVV